MICTGLWELVAQQSDTLGLHGKEIGSGGNEKRPCDVIYYDASVERGGVYLITARNEHSWAAA